jgi:hypothetical protein
MANERERRRRAYTVLRGRDLFQLSYRNCTTAARDAVRQTAAPGCHFSNENADCKDPPAARMVAVVMAAYRHAQIA